MKIAIESTDQITSYGGVAVRVWKGVTEKGTPCFVFVHRIAVSELKDQAEFQKELQEALPPAQIVDLRQVL